MAVQEERASRRRTAACAVQGGETGKQAIATRPGRAQGMQDSATTRHAVAHRPKRKKAARPSFTPQRVIVIV